MRLPFLRALRSDKAAAPERGRPAPLGDEATITAARTRARRRLVGALVLLLIGVIGFPILFETQPRPLPVDTPIETPRRSSGVTQPAPRLTPRPVQQMPALPADTGPETAVGGASQPVPAPPVMAAAPKLRPEPEPAPVSPPAPPPQSTAAVAPAPKPAVLAPTATVAAATPATASAPAAAASAGGRFVVQVGAYSDAATLREARSKVEKLGLKTYTQVIENEAGKRTRVRLGPFASRDEASAAAAKIKAAGLPANILAL